MVTIQEGAEAARCSVCQVCERCDRAGGLCMRCRDQGLPPRNPDCLGCEVLGVLLVPDEGAPLGLLEGGPCGARPPLVSACHCNSMHDGAYVLVWRTLRSSVSAPDDMCPTCQRWALQTTGRCALVLAWEGRVLPAGIFAAWWQADDVLYLDEDDNGLSGALYAESMARLADVVSTWKRNGESLGTVLLVGKRG